MKHSLLFILAIGVLPIVAGCFQPETPRPDQLRRGYILLLPGVECTLVSMEGICRGLRDAGVDDAIDVDVWGYHPFGTFRNLPAYGLNRQRAVRLAGKIADYHAAYPDRPASIIGFSGGGAMALFTAEALPDEAVLDRIVLLGAAISPAYDPQPAMARCQNGLVNFHSPGDWFMAGWATRTFGTMDREYTNTAGRVGFRVADGTLRTCAGITQIAWRPSWRQLGHDGGHPGWLARTWTREVLASQFVTRKLDACGEESPRMHATDLDEVR